MSLVSISNSFSYLNSKKMPICQLWKFKKTSTDSSLGLLPPANEVWGKVMFLYLSVILFTGGLHPGGG